MLCDSFFHHSWHSENRFLYFRIHHPVSFSVRRLEIHTSWCGEIWRLASWVIEQVFCGHLIHFLVWLFYHLYSHGDRLASVTKLWNLSWRFWICYLESCLECLDLHQTTDLARNFSYHRLVHHQQRISCIYLANLSAFLEICGSIFGSVAPFHFQSVTAASSWTSVTYSTQSRILRPHPARSWAK